jgi:hypothetical protein
MLLRRESKLCRCRYFEESECLTESVAISFTHCKPCKHLSIGSFKLLTKFSLVNSRIRFRLIGDWFTFYFFLGRVRLHMI